MPTASESLRIVHVNAETGFSGGEVQVFLLMEGLHALGHHNILVCPPDSGSDREARRLGIECRLLGMRNDLDIPTVVSLARAFRRARPDIVHLHTGRATWLGGMASRISRVPALTTRRMDRPVRRGPRTWLIYRHWVRRTAAISHCVADCLAAGGVSRDRIQVIYSAIDPQRLVPARPRDEVRETLGATRQDRVLLSLAALVRRKGIDVLLDALLCLRTRGVSPVVWIAGEGSERLALEHQAVRLGLDNRVRFLGYRSDKAELLCACDVVVIPSRREGLGVAALEAMAAGRPVVASSVGGLREAVVPGKTGLLVPPEEPEELARALERVIQDDGLREGLGTAGPGRIADGFHCRQMVAAYEQLYRSILQE